MSSEVTLSAGLDQRRETLPQLDSALLCNFELFVEAEQQQYRLRELLLRLAIQGKIVEQDSRDEPATLLLARIDARKAHLITNKELRRRKTFPPISDDDQWFALPIGWEWARLGDLGDWGAGTTPPRGNAAYYGGDVPWFKSGELTADVISKSEETVTALAVQECSLRVNRVGDVLIAMYGATIGKTAILACEGTTNQAVCACTPFDGFDKRYLLVLLKALRRYFIGIGAGGAQPNISREKIVATVVALPPLAEQHRIVARVEELMKLCDALEQNGRLADEQHARLTSTLFDTLAASESAHALAENWQRVAEHFDLLLDRPAAIDELEQTILQLAVRGLLVAHDVLDQSAKEALVAIRKEKERLIAAGLVKRDKPTEPMKIDEQPFGVPSSWAWVRLADICSLVTDGEHATPQRCNDTTAVPLVTAKNVRSGFMDYSVTDFVSRDVASKCWLRCKPELNDILMVSVGATLGRLCVLRESVEIVLVRSVTVLRPVHIGVNVEYLALHLMSFDSQREIWAAVKQSAQPCLYLAKSAALKIALPPLAEQHRIVARVEELHRLCADLRERLTRARETQSRLADALVVEVA